MSYDRAKCSPNGSQLIAVDCDGRTGEVSVVDHTPINNVLSATTASITDGRLRQSRSNAALRAVSGALRQYPANTTRRKPIASHRTTTTINTAWIRLIMKSLIAMETASDCHEIR